MRAGCGNCGGTGWHVWRPMSADRKRREFVWVACADCNDDARLPKPELCEGCGDTAAFCTCHERRWRRRYSGPVSL